MNFFFVDDDLSPKDYDFVDVEHPQHLIDLVGTAMEIGFTMIVCIQNPENLKSLKKALKIRKIKNTPNAEITFGDFDHLVIIKDGRIRFGRKDI